MKPRCRGQNQLGRNRLLIIRDHTRHVLRVRRIGNMKRLRIPVPAIPRPVWRILFRVTGVALLVSVLGLLFSTQPDIKFDATLDKITQLPFPSSPQETHGTPKTKAPLDYQDPEELLVRKCKRIEWGLPPPMDVVNRFELVPKSNAFVRSAFFDKRLLQPNVTILALATVDTQTLFCLFKYRNSNETWSVKAHIEVIPEAIPPFCKWKATVITCANPIPEEEPTIVSVTRTSCDSPAVQLPVDVIEPYARPKYKFGVCMQGLFQYKTEDVGYLIEHFETNKLLGAEQIFMYGVYNVSKVVKSVLSHYIKEGTLTVMPWDLPMKSLTKWHLQDKNLQLPAGTDAKDKTFAKNPGCVRQYAHYLANLHCMYFNMNEFKYLLYMDVDEYIVPRKHSNWHALFRHLEHQAGYEGYASLLFREAQFCDAKERDLASSMYFYTGSYTRLAEVKPVSKSPKPAVRPNRVTRIQVNTAKATLPGYLRELAVDPALATKHVYKPKRYCREKTTQDKTMEKIRKAIMPKINRVANEAGVP